MATVPAGAEGVGPVGVLGVDVLEPGRVELPKAAYEREQQLPDRGFVGLPIAARGHRTARGFAADARVGECPTLAAVVPDRARICSGYRLNMSATRSAAIARSRHGLSDPAITQKTSRAESKAGDRVLGELLHRTVRSQGGDGAAEGRPYEPGCGVSRDRRSTVRQRRCHRRSLLTVRTRASAGTLHRVRWPRCPG